MIAGLPYQHHLPEHVGVLVLGSGLAGCAALLAAAEAGQYAVMLEKTADIGGSTVRSAGLSAFAGTDEQAAQGLDDSVELLRQDLLETGRHAQDEALVDLYCEHQMDTYRWLKGHGVRYGQVHAASGQSAPRSHPTDTTGMLIRLLTAAGRLGARLLTSTAAHRIVREDGRVVGVEVVTTTGDKQLVRADAVVIATGGFSRSPELLTRFAPQMQHALHAGGPGCTGDGMLMAWQLGAGIVDTPYVKGTYGIYPEPHPDEDGTGILAVYKGAIAVNRDGRRFVDESLPYKQIGDAALVQPGVTTWQVLDAQVMAQSNDEVPIYEFAGRERAGMLLRADTIDELERAIGLPDGSLVATVAEYNAAIIHGEPDPLGRRHLSGRVGTPFALDHPPYFAHPTGTVVLATYCGLTVDPQMRVLDVFGEPIPRLYAAGEVIGGFHGAGYMTGTSIGKSGIFGRIAGNHAAAEDSDLPW
nr:FAD-dependent oxidoreductase [Aeromicrobium wangtongii]